MGMKSKEYHEGYQQGYKDAKADYETRLKADVVAMLTELQLEIEESGNCGRAFHLGLQMASKIIQKKINKLKENQDGAISN